MAAFPASGLFVATMVDVLDASNLQIDWDTELSKVALWTNTITVATDLVVNQSYNVSPWDTGEVPNGTGYTTGGVVLTGTTYVAGALGATTYDATDTPWTSSTFSLVRGCLIYADQLAPKRGEIAVNFGADYAVTAGTFTVQWNASGIVTIDWIP